MFLDERKRPLVAMVKIPMMMTRAMYMP